MRRAALQQGKLNRKYVFFIPFSIFILTSIRICRVTAVFKRGYAVRRKPFYDNCILQSPDGQSLCTIEKKKAQWYILKGLGNEVSQDPYIVRLNFEPAGRAVGDVGKYYLTPKENNCVVCGNTDQLIRKNVVPKEYRRHFPGEFQLFFPIS